MPGVAFKTGLLAAAFFFACEKPTPVIHSDGPQRLVSLTPSSTELVVALGLGDHLVGVDRYSDLPSGSTAARVGDFLHPDMEAVFRLKPTLVILDADQTKTLRALNEADLPYLALRMHTLDDVLTGLTELGARVGKARLARTLNQTFRAVLASHRALSDVQERRPRTLFILDRKTGPIAGVVAAGTGSYADTLIKLAGLENVLPADGSAYPKLTAEKITRLRPELILDASPAPDLVDWKEIPTMGRAIALEANFFRGPSPRFPEALAALRKHALDALYRAE